MVLLKTQHFIYLGFPRAVRNMASRVQTRSEASAAEDFEYKMKQRGEFLLVLLFLQTTEISVKQVKLFQASGAIYLFFHVQYEGSRL